MIYQINTINEIPEIALQFINDHENYRVFAFNAQMGEGKTTFIQGLLKAYGIKHLEGSPTYSIVNEYQLNEYQTIYHFDLYRLKTIGEAIDIGIEDMLEDEHAICFIEWPNLIGDLLPENTIHVKISSNEFGVRIVNTHLFSHQDSNLNSDVL